MMSNSKKIQNEIVEIIESLVSFKTTPSNFPEFEKAVKYIEEYFDGSSIKIDKHYFNKYPALFISTTGKKEASIMMQAHVDVVDGNEDQFTPITKNGKMYGRGTSDMKAFVAIAMKTLKEFSDHPSHCNLALALTFDEEIGS
ncbi:MAG: M20/M25/M40 family metallo-hydrolase, partial [Bacteroidota bacterium]